MAIRRGAVDPAPGVPPRRPALPLDLLALVVLAAAIHVGWNAVARQLGRGSSFPWVVALVGVAVLAPAFVWQRLHDPGPIDARAFGFAAVSAAIEAAYFLLLQACYRRAELTLIYPLSRGIGPLLALAPAHAFAGEAFAPHEFLGVALVLVGAIVLAFARSRTEGGAPRDHVAAVSFALLTGAAMASYQLVDGIALRGATAPRPLEYFFLMQVMLAALLTIGFAARGGLTRAHLQEVRAHAGRLLLAGLAIQASYFLILLALRDGKILLVIATRNSGIPISLLVGRLFLKERPGLRRTLAALTIVAGVLALVRW